MARDVIWLFVAKLRYESSNGTGYSNLLPRKSAAFVPCGIDGSTLLQVVHTSGLFFCFRTSHCSRICRCSRRGRNRNDRICRTRATRRFKVSDGQVSDFGNTKRRDRLRVLAGDITIYRGFATRYTIPFGFDFLARVVSYRRLDKLGIARIRIAGMCLLLQRDGVHTLERRDVHKREKRRGMRPRRFRITPSERKQQQQQTKDTPNNVNLSCQSGTSHTSGHCRDLYSSISLYVSL
mmetsp:Transcript_12670/g.25400  ORF Transcript_12670/g.25400 Transcript_12670/m.25400 type:complete len:236 (+) Transcript_12670:10-717(+)